MVGKSRKLTVEVVGDAKGVSSAFREVENASDSVEKKTTQSFKQFTSSIKNAESASGKFSAFSSGAMDQVKNNAGALALAGGAAFGVLAAKGVMAFEQLGTSVGKFADATGVTAEQASRIIEVASDVGVSAESVQGSIAKMSKQLGDNEHAFDEWGITVKKNADGTTDANATFLSAIDTIGKIQDPLKKSEAASKVFGKSWGDMAEIINMGGPKLKANLDAVSDAKVFDEKKVQQSRDLRDAFDKITDAGQDLLLTLGSALAPAITKLAPIFADLIEAVAPAAQAVGEVLVVAVEAAIPLIEALLPVVKAAAVGIKFLGDTINAAFGSTEGAENFKFYLTATDDLREKAVAAGMSAEDFNTILEAQKKGFVETGNATEDQTRFMALLTGQVDQATDSHYINAQATNAVADAAATASEKINDLSGRNERAKETTDNLTTAWQKLKGEFDDEKAFLNLQQTFDDIAQKGHDAMIAVADGSMTAEEATRNQRLAVIDLTDKVIDFGKQIGLTPDHVSKITAEIDKGSVELAESQLAILARNRAMDLSVQLKGGDVSIRSGQHAAGGRVQGWEDFSILNEGGPEAFKLPTGTMVYPAAETRRMMAGGGTTVIVNVHGSVMTERDLVRSVTDGIIDGQRRGEIPAGAFN